MGTWGFLHAKPHRMVKRSRRRRVYESLEKGSSAAFLQHRLTKTVIATDHLFQSDGDAENTGGTTASYEPSLLPTAQGFLAGHIPAAVRISIDETTQGVTIGELLSAASTGR